MRPRGQTHEHALDPRLRLQAEERAPVVHQVELDVAPAPGELEPPLALAVRLVPPARDDRAVGRRQRAADVGHERAKTSVVEPAVTRAQVVEEDSADTPPLLAPVDVDEIVIAPRLEAGMEGRVVPVGDGLERAVEVDRILRVGIGRREVGPATEPRVGDAAVGVSDLEEPHVEMHGGDLRIARMGHDAHPGHEEARALPTAGPRPQPLRHLPRQLSLHRRPVHAALLERDTLREHARYAPAATWALPHVLSERAAAIRLRKETGRLVVQGGDRRGHVLGLPLAHRERHSCTARTKASAWATGTSGRMPCPRLAMCPVPPNASSIACVRVRIDAGSAYSQVGSRLP